MSRSDLKLRVIPGNKGRLPSLLEQQKLDAWHPQRVKRRERLFALAVVLILAAGLGLYWMAVR